jgi:protein involved in polysaccharide export with SLBB domain
VKSASSLIATVLAAAVLAGCASGPNLPACQDVATAVDGYTLGPGDRMRITVFRHPDLSGEFAIDGRGSLALPLGGSIDAVGLTTRELEQTIGQRLASEGYLVQPQVSIEVLTFRPFYILGEVARPGEYEYKDGMIVTTAAALAGGFGYRANQDRIWIERRTEGGACAVSAQLSTPVLPGDTVNVPERFF